MTTHIVRHPPEGDEAVPVGPPTDDAEIIAEWDPVAIAEAKWEGEQ